VSGRIFHIALWATYLVVISGTTDAINGAIRLSGPTTTQWFSRQVLSIIGLCVNYDAADAAEDDDDRNDGCADWLIDWLVYWHVTRVGFGAHLWYHCRISPPRFLAECRKRRLNQGSLVFLYFNLSSLFDLYLVLFLHVYFPVLCLYLVTVCLFSCTALFVSISQVIGCEDRLQNDLYCVGWGVKLCSINLDT